MRYDFNKRLVIFISPILYFLLWFNYIFRVEGQEDTRRWNGIISKNWIWIYKRHQDWRVFRDAFKKKIWINPLRVWLSKTGDIFKKKTGYIFWKKTNSKILGFNKSSRPHFKGVLVSQLGVSAIEWGGG